MYVCSKCQSSHVQRVPRKWWMRLLPGRIRIHCSDCGKNSLIRAAPARPGARAHRDEAGPRDRDVRR